MECIQEAIHAAQQPKRIGGQLYAIDNPTWLAVKDELAPLGLSSVPNSHSLPKQRNQRGLKGLTSHGKRIIRNGIDYLQWRFGKKHLTFGTVTVPDVTEEENEAITREWSQIVRIFNQNIRRKLDAKTLPNWIVSATEIQTERLRRSGIAALHLHFVYVGRHPKRGWGLTPKQVRGAWRSAVISRVPSLSDRDFSASENLQQVRQSASSYLSKYVSKGQRALGDVAVDGERPLPTSWYTCTIPLRRLVGLSVRSGRDIGALLSRLTEKAFLYRRRVEVSGADGSLFTVGFCGWLKPGWEVFVRPPYQPPPAEYLYLRSKYRFPTDSYSGYEWLREVYKMYLAPVHVPVATTV